MIKFKNYCILVMGQTLGAMLEINKISESILGKMEAQGLLIVTFAASLEAPELNEFFRSNGRNFVLFEVDNKTCGYNLNKREVYDEVFGKIEAYNQYNENLSNEMNDHIKEINSHLAPKFMKMKFNKVPILGDEVLTEDKIKKMSNEEKQQIVNKILDKGFEFLSDYDKEMIDKLSKL